MKQMFKLSTKDKEKAQNSQRKHDEHAQAVADFVARCYIQGRDNVNAPYYYPINDAGRFIRSSAEMFAICQLMRKDWENGKVESMKAAKAEKIAKMSEKDQRATINAMKARAAKMIPTPREIVRMLSPLLPVGKYASETDAAPLYFYDWEKARYTQNTGGFWLMVDALAPDATRFDRQEFINRFETHARPLVEPLEIIPVKNGNVEFDANGAPYLTPLTPLKAFKNRLPVAFNPAATTEPEFDGWKLSRWFKELAQGDADAETNLYFAMRCAVDPNKTPEKALFLVDDKGRTGKSTFMRLMLNLVGDNNAETLSIKDFAGRFNLAPAVGKRLIYSNENSAQNIRDNSNFKNTITKDPVPIDEKGKPRYTTVLNVFIVQIMNEMPTFSDKTGGQKRRTFIMKFNKQYSENEANKRIKADYINRPELLEWLLLKVLTLKANEFKETQASRRALDEFEQENNPVYSFYLNEWRALKSAMLPASLVYYYFQAVQINSGRPYAMKRNKFGRELSKLIKQHESRELKRKQARSDGYAAPADIERINTELDEANQHARHVYPEDLKKSVKCYVIKPE